MAKPGTALAKHGQTTNQVSDGEHFCKADSIQKQPVPRAEAMMKSTQSTTKHLAVQQTEKREFWP